MMASERADEMSDYPIKEAPLAHYNDRVEGAFGEKQAYGGDRRYDEPRRDMRDEPRRRSRSPPRYRSQAPDKNQKPDPSNVIGVFGLSLHTTEEGLRREFEKFGEISECNIIKDKEFGRSRGFAFITFVDLRAAEEAVERTNGMELDGRNIRVDYSLTRGPHAPTPGAYMGRPTRREERREGGYERHYERGYERRDARREGGYERRDDGYERRDDGYERRDRGYERRDDGYERRGAYERRGESRPYDSRHERDDRRGGYERDDRRPYERGYDDLREVAVPRASRSPRRYE